MITMITVPRASCGGGPQITQMTQMNGSYLRHLRYLRAVP